MHPPSGRQFRSLSIAPTVFDHPPQKTPIPTTVSTLACDGNSEMAFRFVDPSPFMPRGFQHVQIEGRKLMSRVVMGPPHAWNSDLAIATIEPLPEQQVSFAAIRNVLEDFLRDEMGVTFCSIQPCPFGQAYVRFNNFHDRDRLILASPINFGNVRISFVAHNNGWNH